MPHPHNPVGTRRVLQLGLAAVTVASIAFLGSQSAAAATITSVVPAAVTAEAVPLVPLELVQDEVPTSDSIYAVWSQPGDRPGVGLPIAQGATAIHITLATELADHFDDDWTYALRTSNGNTVLVDGTFTPAGGELTIPVEGLLLGQGTLSLVLSTTGQASLSRPVNVYLVLAVGPGSGSQTVAFDLTKKTAFDWEQSTEYTASPSGSTAAPGSLVEIDSPAGTWTVGPTGDWAPDARRPVTVGISSADHLQVLARVQGEVSVDGSTVTLQIPSVSQYSYWPYFPAGSVSRDVDLTVDTMENEPMGERVTGSHLIVRSSLTLVPAVKPAVDRVQADDRYGVAIAVSQQAFPDGAETAFVVTGANYPDALSAGPAAVHRDAPLLLTTGDSLLPAVASELGRLQVDDVYVVGGVNSISEAVVTQIRASGATVHRIGGADRYAASRALAADAFTGTGSGLVYIATGANFPDALAAGGAAGHADAPVILVNGSADALDAATAAQLRSTGVTRIKIAGGPASVSSGIEQDLAAIAPTTRLWGADRISAAAAINLDAYGSSERAFVVTGYKFPDALAGSAWAGRLGVPLYTSLPECVPGVLADAAARQGVRTVTLIGGPASLAPALEAYSLCT